MSPQHRLVLRFRAPDQVGIIAGCHSHTGSYSIIARAECGDLKGIADPRRCAVAEGIST
jgi:hypothetical protein